jgi:hypothetical protein
MLIKMKKKERKKRERKRVREGGRERERERERERKKEKENKRMPALVGFLLFPLLFLLGPQPMGLCPPTFRAGFSTLSFLETPSQHTQRCTFVISGTLIKLAIKVSYPSH